MGAESLPSYPVWALYVSPKQAAGKRRHLPKLESCFGGIGTPVPRSSPKKESPSHGCAVPAPFNKGAFPPARGTKGFRLQAICRARRPRRAVLLRQGDSAPRSSPKKESPSHGCAVPAPFNKGAFPPARGTKGFRLQAICRARRPRRAVLLRQGDSAPRNRSK